MDLNYKVVYTDSAIDDLNSILSYLNGYGNPNILIHFKKEISFSQSYRVIFRQYGYDYRKMIVRNYIFVYYVDEIKNELIIFRIALLFCKKEEIKMHINKLKEKLDIKIQQKYDKFIEKLMKLI
ncbi:type II toxin-antitoxin system RelE/ParE family toxin [Thomasclavelia cocleata]|uniref:ParE toxin of type II toxin-antitoxin system, parDE n=1 Tax=Thomasclavelia cocleata TaxID=69824 RepID=A0A1I0DAU5_9FIRM|nr:type II toxin-antitoxin system RelE/ParE family toxin [Thomasclavelia cocleata]MCR1960400.1 type II toxin-antitoxin system RelE/ParE family toxin [Thomasclavelia cocleata]NDO41939.1 type II toxin-antitoxin system RelE/ParE family toxin [Thomasclavelia cocleata]PJN80001.1 type II toxin-antitoxin system RelE/ParE family toxin [Thomasclavelia cocleata]SET29394.1 hypothetical protein SAMN04489758_105102 [Thomasclavelia cocleata]